MAFGLQRKCKSIAMRFKCMKATWIILILLIITIYQIGNLQYCDTPEYVSERDSPSKDWIGDSFKSENYVLGANTVDQDETYEIQDSKETFLTFQNRNQRLKNQQDVTQKIDRKGAQPLSKWIVVYSQAGCDVKHFIKMPGWKVVVAGVSPKGCREPICTYVDAAKAKSLGYGITEQIQWNTQSRKMVGYLYAISKGATAIYDVDCKIIPKFNTKSFRFDGNTSGLAFTGGPMFNPYSHFGYPMLYPRGFPESFPKVEGEGRHRIIDTRVPAIQQGQTNFILGKKDVTYLDVTKPINITFDRSSPPVYLFGNRFGPINSMNTVILQEAFWSLFLPTTSTVDADIIRGYFAQRLLRVIGGNVGFLFPTAYCLTPPGGKNQFVVSKQTTEKTKIDDLLDKLQNWGCLRKLSFFECSKRLIYDLNKLGFIGKRDRTMFDVWVSDLAKVGYKEPVRKNQQVDFFTRPSKWNPKVIYASPKVLPAEIQLRTDLVQRNINKAVFQKFNKICPKNKYTISDWLAPPITDIMLVVIYNYPLFDHLYYSEIMHRVYFRHILYCGPSSEGFEKVLNETNWHHITYINGVDDDTWFFSYQCIAHAANMKLNVKGYFYIGDDVLLNTWHMLNFNRDTFWITQPLNYFKRDKIKHPWWYYWPKEVGRKAANAALEEIQDLARLNQESMFRNFLSKYDKNVNISNVVHRSIDAFYSPAVLNAEMVRLWRIFREHHTLLGLAVPMTHAGLVDFSEVVNFKGRSLWRKGREGYVQEFKAEIYYLHPFKAGKDLLEEKGRVFFCDIFLNLSTRELKKTIGNMTKNGKVHGNW